MTYQLIQSPITIPPDYTPPNFTVFSVPVDIILPDGGTESTPAAGSVVEILSSAVTDREYFLFNSGTNEVRLFLGGSTTIWETDPRSPLRLPANSYATMNMSPAKMALFGWSIGGSTITVGVLA